MNSFFYDGRHSFLTHSESQAIKGFLILLIVLGHNSILMGYTGLFIYLYSFHVYCFYILPFTYGFYSGDQGEKTVKLLFSRAWKNMKRLGILYLIWCGIGACVSVFVKHLPFNGLALFRAILLGNQPLLYDSCTFSFLWFIPAVLAVMFWRDVFFLLPGWGKGILFFTGVLLWTATVAGLGSFHSIGLWCPFALIQGLFFSASGIAVRFLLHYVEEWPYSKYWFLLLFPLIPGYVYFRRYLPDGFIYLTWSCCPVIAFLCLYSVKNILEKIRIFQLAGKYSLQIYLLHTLIFKLLLRVTGFASFFAGAVFYLLTLFCCGCIIYLVRGRKYLQWIIFPSFGGKNKVLTENAV